MHFVFGNDQKLILIGCHHKVYHIVYVLLINPKIQELLESSLILLQSCENYLFQLFTRKENPTSVANGFKRFLENSKNPPAELLMVNCLKCRSQVQSVHSQEGKIVHNSYEAHLCKCLRK